MGLGLQGAYGVEGGWDALRNMIATRKKDELLAQIQADKDREFARQQSQDREQSRQFGITNARLADAEEVTKLRQDKQDKINEATRIENTSQIGDELTPDQIVTMVQSGNRNALKPTPIMPTIRGMVSRIGGPTDAPSPAELAGTPQGPSGQMVYGGTTTQQHQAASDALAERRAADAKVAADAAAARGDARLDQSERHFNEALAQRDQFHDTLTAAQELAQTRNLANDYQRNTKWAREASRQVALMDQGMAAAQKGDLNAGTQAVIFTFNKILDPNSVVRESEYARSPEGSALLARIEGAMGRITKGGPGMTPAALQQFADLGHQFAQGYNTMAAREKDRIGRVADKYGLDRKAIFQDEPSPDAGGGGADPASARKKYNY